MYEPYYGEAIVIGTHHEHENLDVSVMLVGKFGPDHYTLEIDYISDLSDLSVGDLYLIRSMYETYYGGCIVFRTHQIHKNLCMAVFSLGANRPDYYCMSTRHAC